MAQIYLGVASGILPDGPMSVSKAKREIITFEPMVHWLSTTSPVFEDAFDLCYFNFLSFAVCRLKSMGVEP